MWCEDINFSKERSRNIDISSIIKLYKYIFNILLRIQLIGKHLEIWHVNCSVYIEVACSCDGLCNNYNKHKKGL